MEEKGGGSLHKEHRNRVKRNFIANGLDALPDHNVLELLLFYSIPQRDVNELAHRLINHFGSLSAVLDADYEELTRLGGVGEHTAVLLKLMPAMARRYAISRRETGVVMDSVQKAGDFLASYFIGCKFEAVYALFLDAGCKVLGCQELCRGEVCSAGLSTRRLMELTLRYNAAQVILAHNHLSGIALPSMADQVTTKRVIMSLQSINAKLRDHLIFVEDDFVSFAESGLLNIIDR